MVFVMTAQAVFVDELGADPSCLSNATPKDDFGGGHADPNLTYAKDLVKAMGLTSKGAKDPEMEGKKVCFVSCCGGGGCCFFFSVVGAPGADDEMMVRGCFAGGGGSAEFRFCFCRWCTCETNRVLRLPATQPFLLILCCLCFLVKSRLQRRTEPPTPKMSPL